MNNNVIDRFLRYTKIYSPSYNEAEFANVLITELKELGLDVEVDDAGGKVGSNTGNIIAFLKGNAPGEPILFSSHMDTVVPCENIEPVIENGTIYSAGNTILSADDKAGVAAIMEALTYIIENKLPHPDIEIVFTICEEVGLLGSANLDYKKLNSKIAYVLDGDGAPGSVTIKSPAHAHIHAEFIGIAKHAGIEPENGISAIQIAAEAIASMKLLRIDSESSANVGTIMGGSADNIVAGKCNVTFEARSLDNDKLEVILATMIDQIEMSAKKFGGEVKISSKTEYEAVSLSENEPVLFRLKKSCEKCNLNYIPEASGGGADASNLYANGINAATLGVGMKEVHSVDEYILVDDILNSEKLVISLMTI